MSLRAFERPLAIAEGCIFMRVIRALHDVAAARHIILTISRTVQLVGIIAAVVLLVALERRIDAFAVRAMERTCACINVTGGLLFCFARVITESQSPFADLQDGKTYRKDRHWYDT